MTEFSAIPIRPHHGMCLAYFEGKGYSTGFTAHMQEMLEVFLQDRDVVPVLKTDEICNACPNNQDGVCETEEKVLRYDRAVLGAVGLSEGNRISFRSFTEKVQEKIITEGLREIICGDCQWNEICSKKQSRWESLTGLDHF